MKCVYIGVQVHLHKGRNIEHALTVVIFTTVVIKYFFIHLPTRQGMSLS